MDGILSVHDYEGFGHCNIGEYPCINSIHQMAVFLEEHPTLGAELLSHFGNDCEAAEAALENYYGCFESLADYAVTNHHNRATDNHRNRANVNQRQHSTC
jgi:antirestriction protein